MTDNSGDPSQEQQERARAGLPGAPSWSEQSLRRAGIDPDRLSILYLGLPEGALRPPYPQWARRLALGLALWLLVFGLEWWGLTLAPWGEAAVSLGIGVLLLQAACEIFVLGSERLAARLDWDHYVAGTAAEILSTIPELVAIAFVIPVSPAAAFTLALITIYLNTLVFSLYSFFLPKDTRGRFLMPRPITEAGNQVLIAGAAIGLTLGLVMLALNASGAEAKATFAPVDLVVVGGVLLAVFGVYVYKLVADYAQEESEVREALNLGEAEVEERRELVYSHIGPHSIPVVLWLLLVGTAGAFMGGERVADFAGLALAELGFNPLITAFLLAGFAGMSEYVIIYNAHSKREFGIALANAFGGITQVMFLVVPFTLLAIGIYQGWINPGHSALPLGFGLSNLFLLIFLFPTFFVLLELLEDDHTLGILDTTIMTAIVGLLILLLVTYGANGAQAPVGAGMTP